MNEWQHKLLAYLRERRRVMLTVDTDEFLDESELAAQFREALEAVPEAYLNRMDTLLGKFDDRWADKWAKQHMGEFD
jgi:hypothetical protein